MQTHEVANRGFSQKVNSGYILSSAPKTGPHWTDWLAASGAGVCLVTGRKLLGSHRSERWWLCLERGVSEAQRAGGGPRWPTVLLGEDLAEARTGRVAPPARPGCLLQAYQSLRRDIHARSV